MTKPGAVPVRSRVDAALKTFDPELADAEALRKVLPDQLADALMRAIKPLGTDVEKNEAIRDKPLLSMHARHSLIIKLRAQGMLPERIARAVGVTRATVDNVVKRWYAEYADKLRQEDMDQFVLLLADGYLEDIDKLTEIVQTTRHPNAIIGAIRARQEARQKYVDVLADFGFLSRKAVEVHVDNADEFGPSTQTNNMFFMRPEDIAAASMEFLRAKRIAQGRDENFAEDDRLSHLIVAEDRPPQTDELEPR